MPNSRLHGLPFFTDCSSRCWNSERVERGDGEREVGGREGGLKGEMCAKVAWEADVMRGCGENNRS